MITKYDIDGIAPTDLQALGESYLEALAARDQRDEDEGRELRRLQERAKEAQKVVDETHRALMAWPGRDYQEAEGVVSQATVDRRHWMATTCNFIHTLRRSRRG